MAAPRQAIRYCKHCRKVAAYGQYDYCSRACATAAARGSSGGDSGGFSPTNIVSKTWDLWKNVEAGLFEDDPSRPGADGRMCKNCLSRPRNAPHEFCSKACGQDYARACRANARAGSPPSSPIPTRLAKAQPSRQSSGPIPASPSRSPVSPPGFQPFQAAPAADCLMCRSTPKMQGSQFCGESCKKNAHTQAPLLLEVYNTDPKFSDIAKQFRSTWKDEGQIPPVIRLYKIVNSQKVEDAYEDYKKSVERNGKFATRGMAPGNENRRWHGTVRKCNIGDSPANLMPCNFQDCFLCSILRTSYDVKRSTLGWFGKGIYSTATSSGSNEYVGRTPPGSNCRAMFLNRVVVGNAYILKQQTESLKGPPRGYDSVIANADQSQGLAYDELVVYKNEAIRPSWLVIYG